MFGWSLLPSAGSIFVVGVPNTNRTETDDMPNSQRRACDVCYYRKVCACVLARITSLSSLLTLTLQMLRHYANEIIDQV